MISPGKNSHLPTINPDRSRDLTAGGKVVSFRDISLGARWAAKIQRIRNRTRWLGLLTELFVEINLLASRGEESST